MGVDMSDTQRMKMFHMRSGSIPDLFIDYPSRGYHGLRLELKKEGTVIYKKDGKTLRKSSYARKLRNGTIKRVDHLAEQAATLQKYCDHGYFARFAIGYEKAVEMIDWYMCAPTQQTIF